MRRGRRLAAVQPAQGAHRDREHREVGVGLAFQLGEEALPAGKAGDRAVEPGVDPLLDAARPHRRSRAASDRSRTPRWSGGDAAPSGPRTAPRARCAPTGCAGWSARSGHAAARGAGRHRWRSTRCPQRRRRCPRWRPPRPPRTPWADRAAQRSVGPDPAPCPGPDTGPRRLRECLALGFGQHRVETAQEIGDARREPLDRGGDVDRTREIAQEPFGAARRRLAHRAENGALACGADLPGQQLQLAEQRHQAEGVARDDVGARDRRRGAAGALAQLADELARDRG